MELHELKSQPFDIAKYRNKSKYIVLNESAASLEPSPFYRVYPVEIRFATADWYWAGNGYALLKNALMQICGAAGATFLHGARTDDGRNPKFAAHSVLMEICQPGGVARRMMGSKSIDVDAMVARDLESLKARRAKGDDQKTKGKTDEQLSAMAETSRAAYTNTRGERAETGAITRAVKALIGMPTSFQAADREKTFVVVTVAPNMDVLMMDPVIRQEAARRALGLSDMMYGPARNGYDTPQLTASTPGMALPEHPASDAVPSGDSAQGNPAASQPGKPGNGNGNPDINPDDVKRDEWESAGVIERAQRLALLLGQREHALTDEQRKRAANGDAKAQAAAIVYLEKKPMKAGAPTEGTSQAPTSDQPNGQAPIGWKPSENQMKRLFAIGKNAGYDSDALHALVAKRYSGITSLKDLTREQYDELCGSDQDGGYLATNPVRTAALPGNDHGDGLPF